MIYLNNPHAWVWWDLDAVSVYYELIYQSFDILKCQFNYNSDNKRV
jgi:hypothetical protein